jgi:hypothetical protein
MAYTIVKSDGTVLTTIADGTINTTSTSLGLPGRNYAGYGQALDTNFVHVLENFADNTPPANPLRGQLWFNTNDNTLRVCPADGESVASEWLILASTSSTGTTTFGSVTITGDLASNNATITNTLTVGTIDSVNISVSGNANITTANIGNTFTTVISTGGNTNPGTLQGTWTLVGNSRLNATYADLAERFESDTELTPGTVVELGGRKEIRAVRYELSEDVFGVISNTAAYLMNSGAGPDKTHPPVAISGRVKVKVVGKVVKGQRLVSAGEGLARAAQDGEATAFNTIGRSLEDKPTVETGTVEAIVIIR